MPFILLLFCCLGFGRRRLFPIEYFVKTCKIMKIEQIRNLSNLAQSMGVLVDRFASCSGLRRLSYGAAQDQRCRADLVSMLEDLCGFEAGPSACRLQTGQGFLDIQHPVDLLGGSCPSNCRWESMRYRSCKSV